MLNVSTFDLITLVAASNSLVPFCFCNLIIAILLVGSSRPSSDVHQEEPTPLPGIAHGKRSVMDDSFSYCHSFNMTGAPKDISVLAESSFVDETVTNNGEESSDGDDENQNEEDDELRRRVEEFIDKVNRGWRAEKLRMHASRH